MSRLPEGEAMSSLVKAAVFRIGQGIDVHAFGPEGPIDATYIRLGGVSIPSKRPLVAHSDGDVLLHALMDALLGALALGDIGQHFPDTACENAGRDSADMLHEVLELVHSKGYVWGNGDLTVVAQKPKISPYRDEIQRRIAELLSASAETVNVKATTTEHLGFTGRSEGIACFASVLLLGSANLGQ